MIIKHLGGNLKGLFDGRKRTVGILVGSLTALAVACGSAEVTPAMEPAAVMKEAKQEVEKKAEPAPLMDAKEQEVVKSIVDIAVQDSRFSTLVAALKAAELVDALQGEGPFTVFAPGNDAFNELPEGTVEALLQDIPALTDILLYHVVPGNVVASDVAGLDSAETLQGTSILFKVRNPMGMEEAILVNEAEILIADIEANNGTIHVIDSVIMPDGTM